MTAAARQRMRDFLDRDAAARGVRFGVRRTGCSGFGYVVELANELSEGERIIDIDGVPLVVDSASMALVEGTLIDFQRQGLNRGFVFDNPNATGACGCGESFTVDPDHG